MAKALLLVDIQNDFLPGGALAVPNGDEVIAPAVAMMQRFPLVFATQDWHPADHGSFASNHEGANAFEQGELSGLPQTFWPDHCVQSTPGAELASDLDRKRIAYVCPKGEDASIDSYSGFFDNAQRRKTELDARLREAGVDTLYICGLATEYCVRFTVLDALALGYDTYLVEDASRGLDADEVGKAIAEMRDAGAKIVQSGEVF